MVDCNARGRVSAEHFGVGLANLKLALKLIRAIDGEQVLRLEEQGIAGTLCRCCKAIEGMADYLQGYRLKFV